MTKSQKPAAPTESTKPATDPAKNGTQKTLTMESPSTLKGLGHNISLTLIQRREVSPDTRIFRFALPSDQHTLGLPIGGCVVVTIKVDGQDVKRAYTPISTEKEKGYFELCIKVYPPNQHPKFPEGGKVSMAMERLQIGDQLDFMGPGGRLTYSQAGKLQIKSNRKPDTFTALAVHENYDREVKKLGLIAGGSGITPMLQVIKQVVDDPDDHTELYLLFANRNEEDILLKETLDEYREKSKGQLRTTYILSNPNEAWKENGNLCGRINREILMKSMPAYATMCGGLGQAMILVCGPKGMIEDACIPNLKEIGWEDDDIFVY